MQTDNPKLKDSGLTAALEAVGGQRRLADLLGISQQAIMKWERVPADRLVQVEAATGVARERLRPDLYRGA